MGGRGSGGARGSDGGGGGIRNTTGASEQAVSLIQQAQNEVRQYGSAQVVINSTWSVSSSGNQKAANPKNADLERQLSNLAKENGLDVNFKTKTQNSAGVRQQLRYGSQQNTTQTKTRIMYAYKAG